MMHRPTHTKIILKFVITDATLGEGFPRGVLFPSSFFFHQCSIFLHLSPGSVTSPVTDSNEGHSLTRLQE